MPSTRRKIKMLSLAGLLLSVNALADGDGLRAFAGEDSWPRWQPRILATPSFSLWQHAAGVREPGGEALDSISLLGDFYFSRPQWRNEPAQGFRATSGLIIGPLGSQVLSSFGSIARRGVGLGSSLALARSIDNRPHAASIDTTPYVGFGYSSGSAKAGWGFSADIGIVARNSSSGARFGRLVNGAQSMDDLLREMRLSPLLNVGVSYSF